MIKNTLLATSLIVILLTACQASPTEAPAQEGEAFELYLVADEQMAGPDINNYELSELPLAEEPIISTEDIDNYLWDVHAINLKPEPYKQLLAAFSGGMPMSGVPFVILAHEARIYAGAFWSPASSLNFDGVVIMQPFDPSGQPLLISLGYPADDFFTGEDPRDDPRLRSALEGAGLLLEK
jgi:hypothetical protein